MTTPRPYASALLAEIDKLNGGLRLMQETVATLVDQRDAARREANVAANNAIRFHHRVLALEAQLAWIRSAAPAPDAVDAHPQQECSPHGFAFALAARGLADLRERQSPDRHAADPGYKNAASLTDAPCNVAGCDHTRPEECKVVRCATCNEPYDGTEPPAAHIARAHLDILARERFGDRTAPTVTQALDCTAPSTE